MRADRRAVPPPRLRRGYGVAERLYRRLAEENSCRPFHHRIALAPFPVRHDRRAERHRLERRNPEIFDSRQDQALRARQPLDDSSFRYEPQQLDVGGPPRRKSLEERPFADDDQALPASLERLDRELDALVRHERRHRSEEHTSELQSHSDLVCRLLLEKKKKKS